MESLRILWDNFKHSNIQSIRVPKGKEEEQEIKNLVEKIMKEKFPNLATEINFQEVQEAQRVPNKIDAKRPTPRHVIIKMTKVKHREFGTQQEKSNYKGVPIRLLADFQHKLCRPERISKKYSKQ